MAMMMMLVVEVSSSSVRALHLDLVMAVLQHVHAARMVGRKASGPSPLHGARLLHLAVRVVVALAALHQLLLMPMVIAPTGAAVQLPLRSLQLTAPRRLFPYVPPCQQKV